MRHLRGRKVLVKMKLKENSQEVASPGTVMINSISLNGSVITSVEAEPSQVAAGTMVAEEPHIEVAEEVATEVAAGCYRSCYRSCYWEHSDRR